MDRKVFRMTLRYLFVLILIGGGVFMMSCRGKHDNGGDLVTKERFYTEPEFKALMKAAEQGDADAQYRVARVYGMEMEDASEEEKWDRMAAENGHEMAQRNVAVRLLNDGKNGKAVTWIQRWAGERKKWAEFYLGKLYADGDGGLKKDHAKAIDWFKKALYEHPELTEEDRSAMYSAMGEIYRQGGYGIEADPVRAYAFYRLAVFYNKNSYTGLYHNPKIHIEHLNTQLKQKELSDADAIVKEEFKRLNKERVERISP